MSPVALSILSLAALYGKSVLGQAPTGTFPPTPLASKHFASPTELPYKVDTDQGLIRGVQFGYNICNSTTEGPKADCQNAYINSIDDFCLWGPSEPNSEVFDKEGEMVAWCTKPGHGTRLIPAGSLTGVQFMRTSDYVQVVGFINQGNINLIDMHPGGEMDPHGADLRGNPMGGTVWSTAWSNGSNKYTQVIEWHNFMGNNQFCFKVCDPSKPNAAKFCEHRYDRIGCEFNAPNAAQKGVFEACEGDVQDFPGTYTTNGQVMTYTQPPEELGAISTMPYTARIPASSNCSPFDSAKLFTALPSATAQQSSASASVTPSGAPSNSGVTTARTTAPAGGPTGSNPTPSASGAAPSGSNSAETLAISGTASFLGVVFAALFLS